MGTGATIDASHQRMLNALVEVRERVYRESYWFAQDELAANRLAVEALGDQARPNDRFDAQYRAGISEMRGGDVRRAIDYLEEAGRIYPLTSFPPQSRDSGRYNLGLAYLRLAENENCCQRPDAESCVFPIRGGGIHSATEGSRKALVEFLAVANSPEAHPLERANATWLSAVTAMTLGSYPGAVPQHLRLGRLGATDGDEFPRFENIAARLGVNRFNLAGAVVVDDFDGDGDDDLVTSSWDPDVDLAYFEQVTDGAFEDRSEAAGFAGLGGGLNLRTADVDNDGDLDLLVLRGGWMTVTGRQPNSLLLNDGDRKASELASGDRKFSDVAFACGIAEPALPTQVAEWADYDLDGDLDFFVGNESEQIEAPSQLFRNDGIGENGLPKFVDVASAAGLTVDAYVKGASWGDFNGDRWPDLYVSCFSSANRLYQNLGDGRFVDVAPQLGVQEPISSFPAWFWDFDNDGNLDIFVSAFTWQNDAFLKYYRGQPQDAAFRARIYRSDGRGGFADVTTASGLTQPMMTMGSNFGDLDNDGYPDMYLGTGNPDTAGVVPNLLLMNRGGEAFVDRTVASGMGHLQKGHGVCLADFDRDGDLDVFEQMGGAFPSDAFFDAVYENPGFGGHWLQVRLRGVRSNSFGVGCRLRAVVVDDQSGAERSVHAWMGTGSSFGCNPLVAHLGLGGSQKVERLEVFWPVTGLTQVLDGIEADQRITVTEGSGAWTAE